MGLKTRMFQLVALAAEVFFGKNGAGISSEAIDRLKVVDSTGSAAGKLAVAPAVAGDEAPTLEQVNAMIKSEGSVRISKLQTDDVVVADGLYVIAGAGTTLVDTENNALVAGHVYLSNGTDYKHLDWAEIPVAVSLVTADDGAGVSLTANHAYGWDTDHLYDIGSTVPEYDESGVVKKVKFGIDAVGNTVGSLPTIPQNAAVTGVYAIVKTPFDGTFGEWNVNFEGGSILSLSDIDPTLQGVYQPAKMWLPVDSDGIITVGDNVIAGGTVGEMDIVIEYVEA